MAPEVGMRRSDAIMDEEPELGSGADIAVAQKGGRESEERRCVGSQDACHLSSRHIGATAKLP